MVIQRSVHTRSSAANLWCSGRSTALGRCWQYAADVAGVPSELTGQYPALPCPVHLLAMFTSHPQAPLDISNVCSKRAVACPVLAVC